LLRRIAIATRICKRVKINPGDVIYSSSDIAADSIPAIRLRRWNKGATLVCGLHLIAPLPLKGFRHVFTKGWQFPRLRDAYYYFSQNYILRQLKKYADFVLVSNALDKDTLIRKGFRDEQVLVCYGAPQWNTIKETPDKEKKFDAVFVGRYHEQKGFIDLIKAVKIISLTKKDFKLALICDISEKAYLNIQNKHKIQNSILFFGFKSGIEKYGIMKQSKLLICPSYYESFGMVIVEAMACALPVVAYNLPTYKDIYHSGMLKADIGNIQELAEKTLSLLLDEPYRQKLSDEAYKLSEEFSWDKTAELIIGRITCAMSEPGVRS
jgi:glycosyltransferase involved in cell wall biosynthesis